MSLYLELPKLNSLFPFRVFINEGWSITYPHWHKEIEFIYSLKGTVNLGVNEEIIQLSEGEIYFFSSGEPHFFLASPDSQRIVFQFDVKLFHEHENMSTTDRSLSEVFDNGVKYSKYWPAELAEEIQQRLLSIFKESLGGREGGQYKMMGDLYSLAYLFYRLPIKKMQVKKGATDETLKSREILDCLDSIFDYIERNYLEAITIQEMAEYTSFSASYFSRFFKKNVGCSFTQYLTEYRINCAKYILGTETLSMAEVAARSGFSSVKTFHHVFKSMVGISPMRFQKRIAAEAEISS